MDSGGVIAASVGEAARQAGGTVTRERYAVLVFEHEAPLRGGQGVRVTTMTVEPSLLSSVEDAAAWYGDTAVPGLARCRRFLRRAAVRRPGLGPSGQDALPH